MTTKKSKQKASPKAIAAITLVVALLLTVFGSVVGLTGMNLDNQGLYKLLAWLPSPIEGSSWPQAHLPGADLGETMVQRYSVQALEEGTETTDADLRDTAAILTDRLAFGGWLSAQVEVTDDKQLELTLPNDGTHDHAYEMLAARGEIGFAGPDGKLFLGSEHIKSAQVTQNPQDGSFAISFALDSEGTRIFGEKTTELVGQNMSLMVDGVAAASPGISEPLTTGQATLPGFNGETSVAYAAMMNTRPLPLTLSLVSSETGAPLLGERAGLGLALALYAAGLILALAFVLRYRLSGAVALWTLVIQLIAIFFFAALIRAPYSLSTLLAIYASFGLLCYALLLLYRGMKLDLERGRSIKQAIKEGYAKTGKSGLDILAGLLLAAVVLIIIDHGIIGSFMRLFAIGMLLDLILFLGVHRVLLTSTASVFGADSKLYNPASARKEAP